MLLSNKPIPPRRLAPQSVYPAGVNGGRGGGRTNNVTQPSGRLLVHHQGDVALDQREGEEADVIGLLAGWPRLLRPETKGGEDGQCGGNADITVRGVATGDDRGHSRQCRRVPEARRHRSTRRIRVNQWERDRGPKERLLTVAGRNDSFWDQTLTWLHS